MNKRNYELTLNVTTGKIKIPSISIYNTDKGIFNIKLFLEKGEGKNIVKLTHDEMVNYKALFQAVKSKTKNYVELEGTLDETENFFYYDLGSKFNDQVGVYNCQIFITDTKGTNDSTTDDEVVTSVPFNYTVTASILTGLNAEITANPDLPVLQELINECKILMNLDSADMSVLDPFQKKEDDAINGTDKNIISNINSINSQIKDIVNQKADKSTTDILENKKIDRNEQNSINMSMLTTEVKTSMTDGKVAVVGTDSVGFTQFSKTIQNDITSIIDISPTTYEQFPAEVTLNKVTIGTSIYYKHIVVNVTEGERYDVTVNCTNNVNVKYIIYCDDELNVIGTDIINISTSDKQNKVLTIPVDTTKMYINTEATSGSILLKKYAYSPIATKKEVSDVNSEVSQISKLVKKLVVLNSTSYDRAFDNVNDIATQTSSIYYKSIIADVIEGEKVYVSFRTSSNEGVKYVHFIDNDYKIISSYFTGYNSTNVFNDSELTVPSGATKIIVNTEVTYNNLCVKAFRFSQLATSNELSSLDNRVVELENKNLNIPSYYNSYLTNKINAIKLLEKNYGCEGESFIFITDLHVDDNTMISPALIQKIVDETNVKNIICGGDLIPAFNQTEDSILRQAYEYIDSYKKINGAKFYTVTGNHDLLGWVGTDTSSNQIKLSDNIRYSILYKNMEDKVKFGNLKQDYFYFDNEVQKIRYVCLGLFNVDTVTSEEINAQIEWLKSTVLNGIDSNWTLFLFGHAGLTTTTGDGWSNTSQPFIDLKSAIENIKISYNIAFYMSGHLHKDLTVFENGIRHISTACDAYYSDDGITRTLGTTNEVCFDVVCVNKTNKTINCVRIGAGSNREFNYN